MTLGPSQPLRITRRFEVSPQRVFDAWLDPQKAGKWLFATPTGQMVRAEIDARVGGSFNFTERRDNQDVAHVGAYVQIDRPRRLVFTFSVPKYSQVVTTVSIDIRPLPTGCELTLTHEGVLPEWTDRTREGWGKILDALAVNLDPNAAYGVIVEPGVIRFERLLPGPIERVWAYLTDSEKRGQWFAFGEMEPHVGGSMELRFTVPPCDGQVYKERVLRYEPPRVLSLGAAEWGGVVTFELAPQSDKVLLVLTQRYKTRGGMISMGSGWHACLATLIERLNGGERDLRDFEAIEKDYEGRFPNG